MGSHLNCFLLDAVIVAVALDWWSADVTSTCKTNSQNTRTTQQNLTQLCCSISSQTSKRTWKLPCRVPFEFISAFPKCMNVSKQRYFLCNYLSCSIFINWLYPRFHCGKNRPVSHCRRNISHYPFKRKSSIQLRLWLFTEVNIFQLCKNVFKLYSKVCNWK